MANKLVIKGSNSPLLHNKANPPTSSSITAHRHNSCQIINRTQKQETMLELFEFFFGVEHYSVSLWASIIMWHQYIDNSVADDKKARLLSTSAKSLRKNPH